ncbi:type VI secretion system tube protein Hcp [Citrobacter amalonaticus]|nr:type VI secretion system tube protein Hcp [Citrobacter amalonaticus]
MTTSIFISIKNIEGTASEPNHTKWIEATSMKWETSNLTSNNKDKKNEKWESLIFTKKIDSASPKLFKMIKDGTSVEKMVVDICSGVSDGKDILSRADLHTCTLTQGEIEAIPGFSDPIEIFHVKFVDSVWKSEPDSKVSSKQAVPAAKNKKVR